MIACHAACDQVCGHVHAANFGLSGPDLRYVSCSLSIISHAHVCRAWADSWVQADPNYHCGTLTQCAGSPVTVKATLKGTPDEMAWGLYSCW